MHPTVFESKVICNKCGYEMDCEKNNYEEFMVDIIHQFKVSYGYGSDRDGDFLKFDLCENCLKWLYSTFKVPVKNSNGWDWERDNNDGE